MKMNLSLYKQSLIGLSGCKRFKPPIVIEDVTNCCKRLSQNFLEYTLYNIYLLSLERKKQNKLHYKFLDHPLYILNLFPSGNY